MRKLAIPLVLTVILSIPAVMLVRSIQWLAPAASLEADTSDYLILLTFDIATVVFVLCTVFLVYALIVFRRRPGDLSDGQHFHSHNALEIGWTVVPTIIVLGLWWLGVVEMRKTNFSAVMAGEMPEGALHVKVTGQQWAWSFEYPGLVDNPSLGELRSDELVLPVGRPVFFDIMSTDVIHSFWVPEMRFKMDAIPGRTNHVVYNPSVIGEYKVRCAEICGTDHAAMRAPVRVVSAEDFDAFVADNDISNLSPPRAASAGPRSTAAWPATRRWASSWSGRPGRICTATRPSSRTAAPCSPTTTTSATRSSPRAARSSRATRT